MRKNRWGRSERIRGWIKVIIAMDKANLQPAVK
jgi:hypothetical protein